MRLPYRSIAGVVLLLGLGRAEGLAQSAPPPSGGTGLTQPAQSQSSQIAALAEQIQALNDDATQAAQDISQLQFAKPKPPANDASEKAKEQYAQALQAWEAQMAVLQKRLDQLLARSNELEQQLNALLSKAASAAQREDLAKQRKSLEAVKSKLARVKSAAFTPTKGPARKPGSGLATPGPGVS